MNALTSTLACPRCRTPLEGWRCAACRVTFPVHGDVAWLFADPGAAVTDWQNRWQFALARIDRDRQQVETALAREASGATQRRLAVLERGYRALRGELDELLQPLRLARGGSLETHLALRTRLPAVQGLLSYDANVHRDWCWGQTETEAALAEVMAVLSDRRFQRVLVLGAGAGRLAYDLHQTLAPQSTVAVDLNPLLAYVGCRAASGDALTLTEFPLAPLGPDQAALPRTLVAPEPARPNLAFVLADVARPPFQDGAFDLVVTPWLLDVIGNGVEHLVKRINRLLTADGTWLNHGSAVFQNPEPALRFTWEEVAELIQDNGFEMASSREAYLPYLCCPDSGHRRTERVMTSCAIRIEEAVAAETHRALPDWIVTGRCPIPALPSFQSQAMTTRVHAFIMSLIDGRRSLKDMAAELERQQLMSRGEAETALRGFLITMHEEAARSAPL
jgi:SAM-dependent methyltransferase